MAKTRKRTKPQTAHQKSVSSATARENLLRFNNEWTPFRLLNLPAELRNRVYRDYIQDFTAKTVGVTRLIYTVLPDLCDVSQQLRREVRPLWFSEILFKICVGANIKAQIRVDRGLTLLSRHKNSHDSGVLLISKRASEILKNAGNDALIRRVRFVVFMHRVWAAEGRLPLSRRPQDWPSDENRIGALNLESPVAAKLEVTQEMNELNRWWRPDRGLTMFATVDPARQRAVTVAQRDQFRGFSLFDLPHIATAFRVD